MRLLCAKTHLQNNCPVAPLVGDSFVKSWEGAAEVFSEIWLGVGELLKADFVLGNSVIFVSARSWAALRRCLLTARSVPQGPSMGSFNAAGALANGTEDG